MEFLDRRAAKILLTIAVFAVGLAIVYIARAFLIVFTFAILFAYLIGPVVRFLQRHSLFFKKAFVAATFSLVYSLAPQFQINAGRLVNSLPFIADRVSTGQIANDLTRSPRAPWATNSMHPLLAIFTLMIGGALGGIISIYLSVPLAARLRVVYRNFASGPPRLALPAGTPTENLAIASSL